MEHGPRAWWRPRLAGATTRDRGRAALGGLVGVALVAGVVALAGTAVLPMALVAPIGASAVLVFAVPASPLAQPWPVVGGNAVSALVGLLAARLVPAAPLAAGLAVGGAILAMSALRCLHPPGGAAALTAVLGGPAVTAAGLGFPLVPVALDSLVLVLAGLAFHRWSGHRYPHRGYIPRSAPDPARQPSDLDRALADLGETLDVDRADLERLLARVDHHARVRRLA